MKKVVNVTEVEGEGLVGLLGQRVTVWSLNYIYAGLLSGVNDDCIRLDDASTAPRAPRATARCSFTG